MDSSVGLKVLSQSSFPGPVSRDLLAISPTIDLSVSVGDDGSTLYIRRPGGDLVSKLTERGRTVQALRWKADGQFLAVAWSGGVVRLMSLENSKAVHTLNVSVDSDPNIKYIGWARNLTGKRGFGKSKAAAGSWQRLLSQQGFEKDEEKELLDLPHELTFLEVDTSLPKLSPLPVSGGSGDDMFVFSTRTSLEFVFQPMNAEDADKVDVMILGTADGGIQLSLYDTFVIGTFGYPPRRQSLKDLPAAMRLYSHASHGSISTHSLLLTEAQAKGDPVALHLVPIDLPFIHSSPVNLALLASKTTTLQKLLRYVKQTQVHMVGEWQAARELPARFIAGVQEELERLPGGTMTIIQALFHTVLTGHTFPAVREWLVDTLAERGHKRWDKAVMSGLENLRGLVHENMIPALERCAIILSRLQGLAKFHEDTEDIGFKSSQITRIMDVVSCLTLVSHKILLLVMEELDLFTVFSSWLRLQIDKLASPSQSEELSEKEATMDYSKVLAYIEGHLQVSPLGLFLDKVAPEDWSRDWEYIEDGVSLLEMLDKQLQKYEEGSPHMKAFPRLDFLVDYLATRASTVFEGIAETQKRCVRFGQGTRLDIGSPISKADIRVVPLARDEGIDSLTFTALVPQTEPSYLYIFRTSVHIINGISSSVWTQAAGLDLAGGRIIDAKFLGDETLLVLWRSSSSSSSSATEGGPQAATAAVVKLVAVPLQDTRLPYKGYIEGSAVEAPVPVSVADSGWWSADVPVEKAGGSSVPSAMEVVGPSSARGEMPARVCLLGKDRVTFKVFGLPDKMEA